MANTNSTSLPLPPAIKSGMEVYDSIMREIEPELTSDKLPLLEEFKKTDSPEQAGERKARYDKAFEEYDKRYKTYLTGEQDKVHNFKRDVLRYMEADANKDDDNRLQALESSLSTAP